MPEPQFNRNNDVFNIFGILLKSTKKMMFYLFLAFFLQGCHFKIFIARSAQFKYNFLLQLQPENSEIGRDFIAILGGFDGVT